MAACNMPGKYSQRLHLMRLWLSKEIEYLAAISFELKILGIYSKPRKVAS